MSIFQSSEVAASQPIGAVARRLLQRARSELQAGRAEVAANTLSSVLALAPGDLAVARFAGVVAQQCGDHAKAVEYYRRSLGAWPKDPALHAGLGIALHECGQFDLALSHLRQACDFAPGSARGWFNLGNALRRAKRPAAALEVLRRSVALDPTYMRARLELARTLTSLGRIDDGLHELRRILRDQPQDVDAWFELASLQTVKFDLQDVGRLGRAFERSGGDANPHILFGFAYAKALEDQGKYVQAFGVLQIVNALQRKQTKWDARYEHDQVDAIIRAFENRMCAPLDERLGAEVIFVVSVPRTGSTLVEQILASHPDAEGAGEILDMPEVVAAETKRRRTSFPLWIPDASGEDWKRLGHEYLARTSRWRTVKRRFIDKNLVNWRLVGAVLAMLPAARIIVVRRDPLETCLGCYRQWFVDGSAGFSYDLDDMVAYLDDFTRLTRFWLRTFPDRVFDLKYEALVNDEGRTIRRLLDFCGLPFDAVCLEPERAERPVFSALSSAQVRQPIRGGSARAVRYGHVLDPLRRSLQTAGLGVGAAEKCGPSVPVNRQAESP